MVMEQVIFRPKLTRTQRRKLKKIQLVYNFLLKLNCPYGGDKEYLEPEEKIEKVNNY